MPRFKKNQKEADIMRITLESVGQLITIGTETLSSKFSGLEKSSLKRSKMLVDLVHNLAKML
jgi:hypothetical protein